MSKYAKRLGGKMIGIEWELINDLLSVHSLLASADNLCK